MSQETTPCGAPRTVPSSSGHRNTVLVATLSRTRPKTTKNRDERRSLLRSGTSAVRDILPREGDLNPIEMASLREPIGQVRFERLADSAQEGDFAVIKCTKATKKKGEC